MDSGCRDSGRVAAWCAGIAGDCLEERRSELFWRLAACRIGEPVASQIWRHVDECPPCRAALETERTLRIAGRSRDIAVYSVCPSSQELLELDCLGPWRRLEIRRHADQCRLCREELEWTRRLGTPVRTQRFRGSWRWAWAAATAALALIIAALYPSYIGSRRFARYARLPDMPFDLVRAEFEREHPEGLDQFSEAARLMSLGEDQAGVKALTALRRQYPDDPSVLFLLGHIAAHQGEWKEAVALCRRAESRPLGGYRCWYLANVALLAGELDVARTELRHASQHERFRAGVERLEKRIN